MPEIARARKTVATAALTGLGLARDPVLTKCRTPGVAPWRSCGRPAARPDAPTCDRHPEGEGTDSGHRTKTAHP